MKAHSIRNYLFLLLFCPIIAFAQKPNTLTTKEKNTLTTKEKKEGWKLLFDGKTTNGWVGAHMDKFPDPSFGWIVKDGMLTIQNTGGEHAKKTWDLVTTDEYGAFDFLFDFKMERGANSGVKYFVTLLEQTAGFGIGLEYQIIDDDVHPDAKMGRNGNHALGGLYDLIAANKPASIIRPAGDWNTGRIVVYPDNRVEQYLNGVKVLEYVRKSPEYRSLVQMSKYKNFKSFGEADKGHLLLQDHGFETSFRNLKIKML